MNTRENIISEIPPVVHIVEIGALNRDGRVVTVLEGHEAQAVIDRLYREIREYTVSCIITAAGIFHLGGKVWLVGDGMPDWQAAEVRCSQDEMPEVQAGFQRRWDRLQWHYAEMQRLGMSDRAYWNRGAEYD